jgi:hypothetical protein
MAPVVPFRVGRKICRAQRSDPHADTRRDSGGARERVQHHARRLADGNDINGGSGSQSSGQSGIAKGVMKQAAGICSIERRVQDSTEVVTEVWNGARQ